MRDWLVIAIGIGFLLAILPNVYAQESIPSPLKQIKSGVLPQDVKCKEGFVLIIRTNGDPTCVKPTSVTRLLSHGWITLEKFEVIHQITNNTSNNTTALVNTTKTVTDSISTNNNYAVRVFNIEDNSTLPITPTITPIKPGIIKPISIGILSYPIKVGGYPPEFTFTFQGISDNPYYVSGGCVGTSLFDTILPSDYVKEKPAPAKKCADWQKKIEPNETITTVAHSKSLNGYYEILKSGVLHVNLDLYATDQKTGWTLIETIQFDVNAIDNSTKNVVNNNNIANTTSSTVILSPGLTTPTISSTQSGIKILSITMSPDPLRVGDHPVFTVTYQNKSDRIFNHSSGCTTSSLHYSLSPSDLVQEIPGAGVMCDNYFQFIQPNGTVADYSRSDHLNGFYTIMAAGTLNVTLDLHLGEGTSYGPEEIIQFNVNATQ